MRRLWRDVGKGKIKIKIKIKIKPKLDAQEFDPYKNPCRVR